MTDDSIKQLLLSNELSEIEETIAKERKTYINKDFIDFTVNSLRQEIHNSGLSLAYIKEKLISKKDAIIKLGGQIIKDSKDNLDEEEYPEGEESLEKPEIGESQGIGIGCGIKYAIYFDYLENQPRELTTYLKKQRIPYATKFSEKLKKFYNS